ncbi:hypothetical protein [Tessaracoccus coleopterorum]|uniref:hypothetical protein n=1 Tax=Tessaracoccus coleopterorum TaxID=2714950 RepID=UPI0018D3D28E|nr:hypothetical protein [Tessaracoccus coleopterorum]
MLIRFRGAAGPNDPLVALVPADDLDMVGDPEQAPDAESAAVAGALAAGDGTYLSLPERSVEAWWKAAEQGRSPPFPSRPCGPGSGVPPAAPTRPPGRTRVAGPASRDWAAPR